MSLVMQTVVLRNDFGGGRIIYYLTATYQKLLLEMGEEGDQDS